MFHMFGMLKNIYSITISDILAYEISQIISKLKYLLIAYKIKTAIIAHLILAILIWDIRYPHLAINYLVPYTRYLKCEISNIRYLRIY